MPNPCLMSARVAPQNEIVTPRKSLVCLRRGGGVSNFLLYRGATRTRIFILPPLQNFSFDLVENVPFICRLREKKLLVFESKDHGDHITYHCVRATCVFHSEGIVGRASPDVFHDAK